jgi:hypothetical protein
VLAFNSTEGCLPEYCRSGVGNRIFISFIGLQTEGRKAGSLA